MCTYRIVGMSSLILSFGITMQASARPEAFEIGPANTAELPGGKEADGIIGDFVLRNDSVVAVVSGDLPDRRANMSTFYGAGNITPGCLYDLTFRGANNDQITYFGPADQRRDVSHVRIASDGADGAAVVRCYRSAESNDGLEVTHDYTLRDGWRYVLVLSTFSNHSADTINVKPKPAWKGLVAETVAGDITTGDAQDPFDRQGYAYGTIPQDGTLSSLAPFDLEPNQTKRVAVALAVGTSPAEAYGVVVAARGATGTLNLRVTSGQATLRNVAVAIPVGDKTMNAYTNNGGRCSLRLPAGSYRLRARTIGSPDLEQSVQVRADAITTAAVEMERPAAIEVRVTGTDAKVIPAKVQFNGIEGTATPNLGPAIRAAGCDHQYHAFHGQFIQPIPPGKYEVVVTRGVEFSHVAQRVEVKPQQTVRVDAKLERLVNTAGWVSTDFHNHSTPSGDNYCGTDDRIANLAAEHIEFAPTTEHNRMYDWQPHIDRLGLTEEISTVTGIELTGAGPHLNSFPHVITPYRQDNGAPKWSPDPRISALTLRFLEGAGPSRWVHLNHPRVSRYFGDRDDDGVPDDGYAGLEDLVDAAEVWSTEILNHDVRYEWKDRGRNNTVENRTFAWLQMLNQGRRMWCIAVSDAHAVFGNGVGGWRTYVPSSTDAPAKIDHKEIIRNAKAGKMFVTNGPFLDVRADDGTWPGGLTIAAGHVDLNVKVQGTSWVRVDKVVVLVNGRPGKDLTFTRASHGDDFYDDVLQFNRTIRVPLSEDAHLIVVATSDDATLATGYGQSWQAKMHPMAYNNPIFVDIDHNGWQPNGDTLGQPLLRPD